MSNGFGILPVVFGCAVSVVVFFVVNAIEWGRGVKPAPAGRFVCAGTSPHLYAATTVDPPPRFIEGSARGENGFGSFFQLYLPRQMNQEGL